MGVEPQVVLVLALVAFAAGFVDAVAGGGGLLQLPALLAAVHDPTVALGVNKVSSISGTSAAIVRYAQHGVVRWRLVRIAGPLVFAGSACGAFGIVRLADTAQRAITPLFAAAFLALAVQQAVRALSRPRTAERPSRRRVAAGLCLVAAIGAYDGFFGPGTGMFLFFALTTFFAQEPLPATGTAKVLNGLTNAGALCVLIARGRVIWPLALAMAGANAAGGWLGAHTAIRRGVRFVRVVTALACVAACVHLLLRSASR